MSKTYVSHFPLVAKIDDRIPKIELRKIIHVISDEKTIAIAKLATKLTKKNMF